MIWYLFSFVFGVGCALGLVTYQPRTVLFLTFFKSILQYLVLVMIERCRVGQRPKAVRDPHQPRARLRPPSTRLPPPSANADKNVNQMQNGGRAGES